MAAQSEANEGMSWNDGSQVQSFEYTLRDIVARPEMLIFKVESYSTGKDVFVAILDPKTNEVFAFGSEIDE